MTITCSPINGHLSDTIIVPSTDKGNRTVASKYKCWQLLKTVPFFDIQRNQRGYEPTREWRTANIETTYVFFQKDVILLSTVTSYYQLLEQSGFLFL